MNTQQPDTPWTKATRSGTQGQCVEMRRRAGSVEVRDSKDPDGAVLRFTASEFAAWVGGAGRAEFDHLAQP